MEFNCRSRKPMFCRLVIAHVKARTMKDRGEFVSFELSYVKKYPKTMKYLKI